MSKSHIRFDVWDDSTLANQKTGKTIEKPLKELLWNQRYFERSKNENSYTDSYTCKELKNKWFFPHKVGLQLNRIDFFGTEASAMSGFSMIPI